ncbi:hypothetical protein GCM10027592_44480 [Spirosoma flavus]
MKKIRFTAFIALVTLVSVFTGCKSKTPAPVSERIAKVWTASKVDENSSTVYTRGATTNVRNYANYKLDLSAAPTVKYTEFDGSIFTGQYSVPSDTRLVLSNLNPQPTGTNGTIEFNIELVDDNNLKLTRTTTSQKTGNSTNVYTLTNP